MDVRIDKIKAIIDGEIRGSEIEVLELDKRMEEGFDPQDWSGGNFDDAYSMGEDEGYARGKHDLLVRIENIIYGEDE